jgi:hypothetical protein
MLLFMVDPRPYRWGKETSSPNGSVRRTQRQARPARTIFSAESEGKREKSIYSENVLRYSENALAKIRAR